MKSIILAAGYATRLYPLTKDKSKSLLEVAGKTILEHILEKLAQVDKVTEIYLVTNNKFYDDFNKPVSNLAVPPFYIYQEDTVSLIKQYLTKGNNPDAPGNFIPWLIQRKDVFAYKFAGQRYDIGTLESYQEVQQIYNN